MTNTVGRPPARCFPTTQHPAHRRILFVLGMHRSGTSALTRVLNLLGMHLPPDLLPAAADNPTGFWEPQGLSQINDRVLKRHGYRWHATQPLFLDGTFTQAELEEACAYLLRTVTKRGTTVFKDPRLCRVLPLWLAAAQQCDVKVRVILPIRNPWEVAQSLTKRSDETPFSLLLWQTHVLEAEYYSRGLSRVFVTYDSLLANWSETAQSILKAFGDSDLDLA